MRTKSTVLITTYNDDLRLEITIRNFLIQMTPDPFEIIVVNDGGGHETKAMLEKVWKDQPNSVGAFGAVGLQYYYLDPPSPDFRLAAARNLGLTHVRTPQTIICDCDTAPGPVMVDRHMRNFDMHNVLIGVRKHVSQQAVQAVKEPSTCGPDWLFKNAYQDDDRVNGKVPALMQKYLSVSDYSRPWEVTWGCNFSFPTFRATTIGGFDEEFVGWGGEDEDLARRMFRNGARFKAIPESYVYHLDHPRRTSAVASQVFYRKFDAEVSRNKGLMPLMEEDYYIGKRE